MPTMPAEPAHSFAALLKRLRHAAQFTQAELAERAGFSVVYISMLERSARLPLRTTVETLAKALALSPEDRQALLAAARRSTTERVIQAPAVLSAAASTASTPATAASAPLQTFLIADIRGSTMYAVEHGDDAWAVLAMRFASIAREVVGARGGQAVELRGDEAMAVFASARAALQAAVELQARFALEIQADPTLRLQSGIGLDAGEAVPVEGGFRGLALNLAARLCSLAGPGEVLASETVTSLAHKVAGLTYTDRGQVSLKGFAAPVRVLQVQATPKADQPASTPLPKSAADQQTTATAAQRLPIGGFLGALPAEPLVAREREVAQLRAALDAVAGGAGRLVLLVGEPGVGKTRLAQEVTLAARDRGFLVATGRCYEPQEAVAYYPFLEALSRAYAAAPADVRAGLPKRWAEVARLLPDQEVGLPAPAASAPTPGAAASSESQQRLCYQVTGFLQALAALQPLALLLDDLHWADSASLDLLAHLARHTRSSCVLLLGTYRDVEVGRQHPLEGVLRDLARERMLERVAVKRLSIDGTRALIAANLDEAGAERITAEFTHAVYERPEGNPFFTQEVMHALVEQGDLYHNPEGWGRKAVEELLIPESVRSVLGQRLSRLDALAQEVLAEASVLGQTFTFDEVLGMAVREEAVIEASLQEAVTAGLVSEMDADHFGFSHALVQQALYRELPARKRRRLHRAAGAAIEKLSATARERQAAELVYHFLEGGEDDRALPYALQAGSAAEAVYAHAEAEKHYRTAVELARELGERACEGEGYEKLSRPVKLLGRADESRTYYEHAIECYVAVGDRAGELRAHRWLLDVVELAELPRAQALADSVVVAESGPEVLRGLAQLSIGLSSAYLNFGRYHEALAAGSTTERIARRLGDDAILLDALFFSAQAALFLGEDVLQALLDLRPLADRCGDVNTLMWMLLITGLIYLYDHADLPRAKAYLEQALEVAERRRTPYAVIHALIQCGAYHYYAGEWGPARSCVERATGVMGQLEHFVEAGLLFLQGTLQLAAGRDQDAERYFGQARVEIESGGTGVLYQREGRGVPAECDLVGGNATAALAYLKPPLDRPGVQEWGAEPLLPLLAWAQLTLDRDDEAAATLAAARARCGKLWLVDVLRVEALLAIKLRRWQDAASSLEEALTMGRAMPYPYGEAKALYVYGQLHAAKGELERAHEQYEQALAICERLGEGLYRPHIERALAALSDEGDSNTAGASR